MKPLNPYQGEAPRAMSMMGQGILEAGANIGKTLQAGYEGAGAAIAKGITSAASAYADYKKLKTEVAADEKVLGTLVSFMPEDMKKLYNDTVHSDIPFSEKAAMYKRAYEYIGGAVSQKQAIDKLKTSGGIQAGLAAEEQKAAAARQAEQLKANEKLQQDRIKAEEDLARFKAVSEAAAGGAFIFGPGGAARATAPAPDFTQKRKMNIGGGVYDRP
jgi:hypothetical protein